METEKLIQKQFESLPTSLQQSISSFPWKTVVQEIGRSSGLIAEEISSLEQETLLIIYAFEEPENYIANLIQGLEISQEKASQIATGVANKVFIPILEKRAVLEKTATSGSSLPAIEEGEVAHNTTPEEKAFMDTPSPVSEVKAPITPQEPVTPAKPAYPGGADPYREPIE